MRAHAWLTIVVALAFGAGLTSFMLASPDQSRRPSGDQLGFRRLTDAQVDAAVGAAAEHHAAAHRTQLLRRGALRNARAWLGGIAGSRDRPEQLPAGVRLDGSDAAATRRIASFVRWADDIAPDAWSLESVVAGPVDDASRHVRVTGVVELTLMQAATRTRSQRVDVTVELEPVMRAPRATPSAWRIVDLDERGGASFLRAYDDPLVARRATLDVVGPAAAGDLVAIVASDAARMLPVLANRWTRLGTGGIATLWLLDDASRARDVLGRSAPPGGASPHDAVWADQRGEVVLDIARLRTMSQPRQLAALRHALTHIAVRGLDGAAPPMWGEGVAAYEQRRLAHPRDIFRDDDLVPLIGAFGERRSGLAKLLVAKPDQPLDAAGTDQLAALATIAWLEQAHGHRAATRLLQQLAAGVPPERVLGTVLAMDAREVEVAVARWLRAATAEASVAPSESARDDPKETT